ncbi:ABC transporter permease [Pectobacterium parmentieri]|uniref:ABC transporter permease n=1 Tax=Pectobacterium parmentieri TaxID=1905730 RepID=UPI000EB58CFA|nr:ABC transporter permease [Pectobacterium parmentieri]AYH03408.1 ABC transporter permease [Pectobacterium parmentieri]AYH29665.1 ABC transporter permease [Pectobacterium parmentieri]AYH34083.1 ABC transporter permease [Pectobacterium parmentieri]MBI0518504.1 ABC transporter permease [Pectobacterium parmentieri]
MMPKYTLRIRSASDASLPAVALSAGYPALTISLIASLIVPLLVLTGWWLASRYGWMSEQILPSPLEVIDSARDFVPEELIHQLPISLMRLAIGFSGGIALGLVLGSLFGLNRRLNALFMPLFTVIAQIPTLAWIPLLMLSLGIGEALKLVVLVKSVTVPVTLYTCAGIQQTPQKLHEMARSLRLPPIAFLRYLILPAMLPYVMTGVRLAFSTGWVALIAVELLASSEGLGYLLVQSRQLFMLDLVFVCILIIGILGFSGERVLLKLERRWIHWPAPILGRDSLSSALSGLSLTPWLAPLVLVALWQVSSTREWVNVAFLPAPSDVIEALWSGLVQGGVLADLNASLLRALQGFLLGSGIGALVGALLGNWRIADRLFNPALSALRCVALFAWLPLITAWFGLGESAKIVFIAVAAFFPVMLATRQGIAQLPPALLEVAQVLRLTPIQTLRTLVLPSVLPPLFSGLRLALMHAWTGAIGAEYFMPSGEGLGGMMIRAQQLLESDRIMAGVVLIAIVAALFSRLIALSERRLTRWRFA